MQKLIVALTLLFGGIAANDRDGHSRLLRGRGKTVDYPDAQDLACRRDRRRGGRPYKDRPTNPAAGGRLVRSPAAPRPGRR